MKLALITGGSKGLGKALVELYADLGWEVREFSRSGAGSNHVDCDFSDASGCAAVLQLTFAELATRSWSEVVLINNVGTLDPIGPVALTEPVLWRAHIQINISSCVTAAGLFLKTFTADAGDRSIVNISSGAAATPYYGWSLYCASKAALETFTQCLALEQVEQPNPVSVIAVRPGVIDTDMQSAIRSQDPQHFKDKAKFVRLKSELLLLSPDEAARKVHAVIVSSPTSGEIYDVRDL